MVWAELEVRPRTLLDEGLRLGMVLVVAWLGMGKLLLMVQVEMG